MYDNVYLAPFGSKFITDLIQLIGSTRRSIREFKLHVCGKGQTLDSSWEFLKMENEEIKTAQKILIDKELRESTNICVEKMNSRRQTKGNLVNWYKFAFAVWRKRDT